jgi:outer membrane protein assembly factor BamB
MTHSFRSTRVSPQRARAERQRGLIAAGALALAFLLGGCAHSGAGHTTTTGAGTRTVAQPRRQQSPAASRSHKALAQRQTKTPTTPLAKPRRHEVPRVTITVVDGDSNRRVAGATVQIEGRSSASNRQGRAILRVRGRVTLLVQARADGYKPGSRRFSFRRSSRRTIRIYRPATQWPMYGVNPARTQAQTAIRLRPPFRVVWSLSLGSLVEFPAVVSDGMAYVSNSRGTVRAISMRTGKVAWRRQLRTTMAASPAVAGKSLIVHTMGYGRVYVLRRSDGKILYRRRIGAPIESSPVVERGVDYFGAWNGRVYALDLRRRRFRWVYNSGYKITAAAALGRARVYIGDYGGRLLALSKRTGKLRFAASVNGKIYGTAAVAHGRIFVPSSTGNSLTAFSTGGRRLWTRVTGNYVYSSPAVWRGRVYFGSYNGVLYCLSAARGRTLWSLQTGGAISAAVVVVDGVVYAGNFAHRIYGVDALSGRVLVRFPHGEYVPVSGNGQRLLFHGYSRIWALEPKQAVKKEQKKGRKGRIRSGHSS